MEKVALVTGASRGIGAHLARALAGAGYAVAAVARSAESLAGIVGELRDGGSAVLSLPADVTDVAAVEAVVERTMATWGRIDVLVNNAGSVEAERPIWEADPEQWWAVLEANVRGPFLLTRAVAPHMIAAGGGRIINMNSGAGTRERAPLTAYTASKTALARITGGTAEAGAEHGLYAFDLAPGVVRTDMTRGMSMHRGRTEWTDPEDVIALALALASGELDAFSGRMVRAGADTPAVLRRAAERGLPADARKVRLLPWGDDDPMAG